MSAGIAVGTFVTAMEFAGRRRVWKHARRLARRSPGVYRLSRPVRVQAEDRNRGRAWRVYVERA